MREKNQKQPLLPSNEYTSEHRCERTNMNTKCRIFVAMTYI